MRNRFISIHWDFVGFTASALCAVHCVLLPFILTYSTLGGLHFLENPLIEWTLIITALIIALHSLWHSYAKHHKKIKPIIIASLGFGLIILGHVLHELFEPIFLGIGGMSIAIAHFINWKYLQ